MTLLLIDADIIAFKACASAETPVNWGDGHWTLHCYEDDVAIRIDDQISKLEEEAPVQDVVLALSDTNENFRKKVAPYYKANRKDVRKPMLLPWARQYMLDKYNTVIYKGLEADDVLGILGSNNAETIIWSEDKDLLTVPAKHWIDGEVFVQDKAGADYNFYYQTLVGDSTDNYKGCPKVGSVTAHKLLGANCSWDTVVEAYAKQGLSEAVAIEQAQLARILRDGEYDTDTGKVTLWNGTT
jgi:DNA polymerase I